MMLEEINKEQYVIDAIKKLGIVHKDFRMYLFESLGDGAAGVMKLTGCVFRVAKKGKNKGDLCIKVPGSTRVSFMSSSEIEKSNESNQ